MNFTLSSCGRSETRSVWPNTSVLTSASRWPGISPGRHSISTSRNICSRMPPCSLTPGASPLSTTGTLTRRTLSMAMRFRSTCSKRLLMGSNCQSTIITLAAFAVEAEIENRVVPGLRIQDAPHLLGIDSDGLRRLCRRRTPRRESCRCARSRRASFLLPPCRGLASTFLSAVAVAIILSFIKTVC